VRLRWLIPSALLCVASGAQEGRKFLEGEERAAFLRKVRDRMGQVKSFVADFDQEKSLSVFKDKVKSSGFLLFERPDRLRWEIREPFRSQLVVAGDRVAKFEFVGGVRRALKLGRAQDAILVVMERLRGWFRGEFDQKGEPFDVSVSSAPGPLIVLTPRDESLRKNVEAIELVPTDDLVSMRSVTIRERGGDRTVMTFGGYARDVTIPPGAFSLDEPADIDPAALRAGAGRPSGD
jgi:outer membrane lipoprotein-sorting protein